VIVFRVRARKNKFHHEGHEEHEVKNLSSKTFVAFVYFVVKMSFAKNPYGLNFQPDADKKQYR